MVRGEMVYTRDIQSIIAAFVRDLWGMIRKQKYIIYTKYVETVQLDRILPVYLNILWSNEEDFSCEHSMTSSYGKKEYL